MSFFIAAFCEGEDEDAKSDMDTSPTTPVQESEISGKTRKSEPEKRNLTECMPTDLIQLL